MFVCTEASKGFQCKQDSDRETRNNRTSRIIIDNSSPASGESSIRNPLVPVSLIKYLLVSAAYSPS